MTNNLYYFIMELIPFLFILPSDGLKIAHFLIAQLSEIFAFLGYMVYLEILELNFCGLSDNIEKKLAKIGDMEFRKLSQFNLKSLNLDESQSEEDDETSKNSDKNS